MKIGRKVPLVRQLGITDCGAACLTMIFQYYGCKVNINDIKRKLDTGRDGEEAWCLRTMLCEPC